MFSSLHPSDSGEKNPPVWEGVYTQAAEGKSTRNCARVPKGRRQAAELHCSHRAADSITNTFTASKSTQKCQSWRRHPYHRVPKQSRAEAGLVAKVASVMSFFFSLHAGLSGLLQFGLVKGAFSFWRLKPFWNKQKAP